MPKPSMPLVAIVGPTASGKSEFALQVACQFNGAIVCADSRTVYKEMDIGTAKPTPTQRKAVPHYLLDIVNPDEVFTAADFKRYALRAMDTINQQGKLPIIVGGSGLYVDALLFDYEFGAPADPEYRAELQKKTVEELQDICRKKNIVFPNNIQNKRHLIRAIELGGLPHKERILRPHTLVVGISIEKDDLYKRIDRRAHDMLSAGLVQEVQALASHYGWNSEAMTANVYRVFRDVLAGVKTEDEALQEVIKSDKSLAKRQLTWFRRNPYIVWGTPDELMSVIAHFLRQFS